MTKKSYKKFNSAQAIHMSDLIETVIANNIVKKVWSKRLAYCKADVICYEYKNKPVIYALRSYNTIVAYVMINGGAMYGVDILRYKYGYTNTSQYHISKFFRHYLRFKGDILGKEVYELRYYP